MMNIVFVFDSIFVTILVWICVLALITLLILKELLRAYNGPRTGFWMRNLNIAIAPLLTIFAIIIIFRLIQML